MKSISMEEQKEIMLNIMDYIHEFCKEKKIRYYMIGGTLLGAVRHKGFIPWDDDIDIGLKRDDYEYFVREFNNKHSDEFVLVNNETLAGYHLPQAKVISKKTILQENVPHSPQIGVFVDVFPLDYCPSPYENACRFLKEANIYRNIMSIKNVPVSRERGLIRNAIILAGHVFLGFIPRHRINERINTISSKYLNSNERSFVAEMTTNPYGEKEIYKSEWFGEPVELEFENRFYYAPSDYRNVLKKTFGDYMKLPPVEKRITHHNNNVWWA